MSFTTSVRQTKPANTLWWGEAYKQDSQTYLQWVRSQPGVISYFVETIDENNNRIITVFENEAAYNAFVQARATNTIWQARAAYFDANNISSSMTIL